MHLKKTIIFISIAATIGLLAAAFFTNNLFEKPGARLVDKFEGMDITPLLSPNDCLVHLPWGVHQVQNTEVQKRLLYMCKMTYAAGYDTTIRMPLWTSEILDINMLEHLAIGEKLPNHIVSTKLPTNLSLTTVDYTDPYYSPGHMASAENMFVNVRNLTAEERQNKLNFAMMESFAFTNTAPMVSINMKNNIWLELELLTKKWLIEKKLLYIVTGPLFLNNNTQKFMGPNNIPIPSHFYKIIVNPRSHGSVSFIIPNKEIFTKNTVRIVNANNIHYCVRNQGRFCTLNDFIVSMGEVERVSGITFFPKLAPHFKARLMFDADQ